MISPSYDVEEFVQAVQGRDYLEIIYSAVQEATEAERISYRQKRQPGALEEGSRHYANALKDLVALLRSGSKPRSSQLYGVDLFQLIFESQALPARFHALNE